LPTIYIGREVVDVGGLMSYRPNFYDSIRLTGNYAGRVLKGERPADLPVQQASRIDMVLNLKTAKALGLAVPLSILLRADEVIEWSGGISLQGSQARPCGRSWRGHSNGGCAASAC
jgi:putative tryptophan/tyrosine transport system substrate-binding protein